MTEVGRRLRALFEEIAPPVDVRAAMAAAPRAPRRSGGWAIAAAAGAAVLLGGGGWLLFLRHSSVPIEIATPPGVTTSEAGPGTTAEVDATSTSRPDLLLVALHPVRVNCTSELPSFACGALIDDDPDNSWNAREGGVGVEVTFYFSPPVQIAEIVFHNLEDAEGFARNARIRSLEVSLDDLPQSTSAELQDSQEPQRVQVRSLSTSRLTITITGAYPGQVYAGRQPFGELALQAIEFYGRVAPEVDGADCDYADYPVVVPDLVAVSESEAVEILSALGVCPDHIRVVREPSASVLAGLVVRTRPASSDSLLAGGVLTLVISADLGIGEPIPGDWFESSLSCCGPSGYVRDLLWDGEQFLALARQPGGASVWRSEDGLAWEEVAYLGDFATLEGPGSLDHGEAGYLAGGSVGDQATVWHSSDGRDWTQVTLGPGGVRDVAVTPNGLVAVGTSERRSADAWQTGEFTGVGMVWTSSDGPAWQAEDLGSLPAYSEFSDVHMLDGRLVAIGSSFATPSPLDRRWLVAVSGRWGSWEVLAPAGLSAFQFDTTALVHRYLAAANSPDQVLWTTADGESWLASPLDGLAVQAGGTFLPVALAGMGEVLVAAGGENYVPAGEVYNRDDPAVWLREPDGTWRRAEGAPALDPPGGIVYLAAASADRVVLVLDTVDDRLLIWVFRPKE